MSRYYVQHYFESELRTVSQPTLNIKQIGETDIVVPPISIQDQFIQRLNALDEIRERIRGHVRQHGGNSCVAEVAVDHAATVVICGVVASINVGMSSAIGSVCM
jgi:hypothetical protein